VDKAGDELVDAITLPADAPGPFAYCVARIAIDALLCQVGAASVFPSGNQAVRLPVSGPGLPDRMSLANQGSDTGGEFRVGSLFMGIEARWACFCVCF